MGMMLVAGAVEEKLVEVSDHSLIVAVGNGQTFVTSGKGKHSSH